MRTSHMNDSNKTNSINENAQPKPGKRAAETRTRRRQRAAGSYEGRIRLSVNEDLLDRENFAYRWVNDSHGRIDAFTKRDDWDVMTDPAIKEDANSEGAQIRQLVGSKEDGSPLYAYLCKKPLEYHREDQARRAERVDELESSIKRGQHKDGASADDPKGQYYVPDDGIHMETGKQATAEYKP